MVDVTQSTMDAVLAATGGDQSKARALLGGAAGAGGGPSSDRERAALAELEQLFPAVPRAELWAALAAAGGTSVDGALPAALAAADAAQRRERQREAAARARQAREAEDAAQEARVAELLRLFAALPPAVVQREIDAAEGDVNAATDALLRVVAAQDASTAAAGGSAAAAAAAAATAATAATTTGGAPRAREEAEQQARLRELQLEALAPRFELLPEREVRAILEGAQWDMRTAAARCLERQRQTMIDRLATAFPAATPAEIAQVLAAHRWNQQDAASALADRFRDAPAKTAAPPAAAAEKKPTAAAAAAPATAASPAVPLVDPKDTEDARLLADVAKRAEADLTMSVTVVAKDRAQREATVRADFAHAVRQVAVPGANPRDLAPTAPAAPAPPRLGRDIDAYLNTSDAKPESPSSSSSSSSSAAAAAAPPLVGQSVIPGAGDLASLVLAATPAVVDAGKPITVSWTGASPSTSSSWDWVAMYKVGEQGNVRGYTAYQWRTKDAPGSPGAGSLTFTAPAEYGEYVFKFLENNRYDAKAISGRVCVGPRITLSTEVTAGASPTAGKTATVRWTQESGNKPASRAWIGLFVAGEPKHQNYLHYEWVPSAGLDSAGKAFTLPVKPGDYEFRFFPANTDKYACVARSAPIRVTGDDKITVTEVNPPNSIKLNVSLVSADPAKDRVWVGIFIKTDLGTQRRYKWVSERSQEVVFSSVPRHKGTYVARLMTGYAMLAESADFELPDNMS